MPAASRKGDAAKAKGGEQAPPANKRPAEEMMDVEEESSGGGMFLKGVPVPKAEKNASKVLAGCWKDRCMGVAMLFRARGCDQKELADTLIKNMTAGPCPSPSLVEYTKEVLLEIWRNRPDLADACMRSIMDKSQPGNPLTFHAAAEVCEIYLLNVWWSSDPSERHEAKYAKTCLSSMSFLLSAVDYWIAQRAAAGADIAKRIELASSEATMEKCVKVLVSVLSSEGTAARLFSLSRDAPDEWAKFSSSLVRNVTMEGQPKLSKLASVVRILSSPSLSSFAVEPELLGEDGLGDEVIRRTLMLAVWSAIDKSNHRMCGILSGGGGESSLLELSPLLHDIRMLQGARSNYFMYNVWLSTLFVLHGAKPGTTEAAVAQDFLLTRFPAALKKMREDEVREAMKTRCPLAGMVPTDDTIAGAGAFEKAFAKVAAWPLMLHISQPLPQGAGAPSPSRCPGRLPTGAGADVWEAVCEVYIREKVMTLEAVRAEIPALGAGWSPPAPMDVGEAAMLNGEPPATEADVALLREMVKRPGRDGWLAACKEVYRVRSFSLEMSKVIAGILGTTPEGEAITIEAGRQYVALLSPLKSMPGLIDLLKAHGHIVEIVMGLVQRIDVIGGLVPVDYPKPEVAPPAEGAGTDATEPEIQGDAHVHNTFGELFLFLIFVLNRFRLHVDDPFRQELTRRSKTWEAPSQRGCVDAWLRRHLEIQVAGKLNVEDRTVENSLVDAVFNENWGKNIELRIVIQKFSPWAICECVPSFTDRVFQGCSADRMTSAAAAQALNMLISVLRYSMVDVFAHIINHANMLRVEQSGPQEIKFPSLAADMLLKIMEKLVDENKAASEGKGDDAVPLAHQLVVLDYNAANVIHKFTAPPPASKDPGVVATAAAAKASADATRQTILKSLDIGALDMCSHKKVVYDVLVGVRRGGPNPFYMDVIRALKKRITPYEIAHTIVQEAILVLSQSAPSGHVAMFNLASIGAFLVSHCCRDRDSPATSPDGQYLASNPVAESFMKEVLSHFLQRLESPRQCVLLARFTVILSINLGSGAWSHERSQAVKAGVGLASGEGPKTRAGAALRAAFGPIPDILARLAASRPNNRSRMETAVLSYALLMASSALRVRWLAHYMDVPRLAKALRAMGYKKLAAVAEDAVAVRMDAGGGGGDAEMAQ